MTALPTLWAYTRCFLTIPAGFSLQTSMRENGAGMFPRSSTPAAGTGSPSPSSDLDRATALEAARLSIQHAIAMADSVMLATAHRHRAMLWTQDPDFDGLPGVRNPAEQ